MMQAECFISYYMMKNYVIILICYLQSKILNNSIMNNWQGIFPLKTETRNNKGGFDDFKELWEEARKEDEQARNNANNNTSSW